MTPEELDVLKQLVDNHEKNAAAADVAYSNANPQPQRPDVAAPYNDQAGQYRTQANQIEKEAQTPYPQPHSIKERIVAGLQSGMQDFGRLGAPGGSTGQEALHRKQFDDENTVRYNRVKELRTQAQQQQEFGATLQQRDVTNRAAQDEQDLNVKREGRLQKEADAPKFTPVQPGQPVMQTAPGAQPTFSTAPGEKPVTRSNFQRDTVMMQGQKDPVDVLIDVDPDSKTAHHVFYNGVDVTGKTSHYEKPNAGAATFAANNPGSPTSANYIAEQVRQNPLNWSLTGSDKVLQNQVREILAKGGQDVNFRTASERDKAGALDVMIQDAHSLAQIAATQKGSIGPIEGRIASLKMATVGTGDADTNNLFRLADNLGDQLLRARSGAQINETEYKRLRALVPNPRGPEDKFFSDLAAFTSELERTQKAKYGGQESGGGGGATDAIRARLGLPAKRMSVQ